MKEAVRKSPAVCKYTCALERENCKLKIVNTVKREADKMALAMLP